MDASINCDGDVDGKWHRSIMDTEIQCSTT